MRRSHIWRLTVGAALSAVLVGGITVAQDIGIREWGYENPDRQIVDEGNRLKEAAGASLEPLLQELVPDAATEEVLPRVRRI